MVFAIKHMSSKYGSWKDKGSVTELGKIHTMGETMVSQVIYDNLAIKNIRILKHLNSIYSRNILKLRWIIKKKKNILEGRTCCFYLSLLSTSYQKNVSDSVKFSE